MACECEWYSTLVGSGTFEVLLVALLGTLAYCGKRGRTEDYSTRTRAQISEPGKLGYFLKLTGMNPYKEFKQGTPTQGSLVGQNATSKPFFHNCFGNTHLSHNLPPGGPTPPPDGRQPPSPIICRLSKK